MPDPKRANIKMINKSVFILFLSLCFCTSLRAQKTSTLTNIYTPISLKKFELKSDSISSLNIKTSVTKQNYQSIYQSCLGVFCKFENDILKSANVPVRFRLGSTEYVDRLEQKVPAYKDVSQYGSGN